MSKKTLDQCRSGDEIIACVKRGGGEVLRQSGSHVTVTGPNGGRVVIPNHPGDLATGTRFSIIKALKAIGLAVLILGVLLPIL